MRPVGRIHLHIILAVLVWENREFFPLMGLVVRMGHE